MYNDLTSLMITSGIYEQCIFIRGGNITIRECYVHLKSMVIYLIILEYTQFVFVEKLQHIAQTD